MLNQAPPARMDNPPELYSNVYSVTSGRATANRKNYRTAPSRLGNPSNCVRRACYPDQVASASDSRPLPVSTDCATTRITSPTAGGARWRSCDECSSPSVPTLGLGLGSGLGLGLGCSSPSVPTSGLGLELGCSSPSVPTSNTGWPRLRPAGSLETSFSWLSGGSYHIRARSCSAPGCAELRSASAKAAAWAALAPRPYRASDLHGGTGRPGRSES